MVYTKKRRHKKSSKTYRKRSKTSKGGFLKLKKRGKMITKKNNSNNKDFIFDSEISKNNNKNVKKYRENAIKVLEEFSEFLNEECAEFLNDYRKEASEDDFEDHYDLPSFFERVARSIDKKAEKDKKRLMGLIYGTPAKKKFDKTCKNLTRILKNMSYLLNSLNTPIMENIFNKQDLERFREVFAMIIEHSDIQSRKGNYVEEYLLPAFVDVDMTEFNKIVFDKDPDHDQDISDDVFYKYKGKNDKNTEKPNKDAVDLLGLSNNIIEKPRSNSRDLRDVFSGLDIFSSPNVGSRKYHASRLRSPSMKSMRND